jgi:hypothetical protein
LSKRPFQVIARIAKRICEALQSILFPVQREGVELVVRLADAKRLIA